MTDERLAVLRSSTDAGTIEPTRELVDELLAEVDRLREQQRPSAIIGELEALRACRTNALEDAALVCDEVEADANNRYEADSARKIARLIRGLIK